MAANGGNDTAFNLANTAPQTVAGYTRATRVAITGENLIKLKDSVVKQVVKPLLTGNIKVQSFDPTEMGDKTNFFHFVGGWHNSSTLFRNHCKSYYLGNVFSLVTIDPLGVQLADADGTLRTNADGTPMMGPAIAYGDSLFDVWHNVELDEVIESVRIYINFAQDVDRQNLQWTWELLLQNIDEDLRHYLISETDPIPNGHGQTGPVGYFLVARKIMTASSNLSHNVVTGLMLLELRHFPGEDVQECVFVLRNVLKFLNHGHARFNRAPPTIMDYLIDVFLKASNRRFRNYVLNLRDFHPATIDTPERLFGQVQEYYNNIITKPGEDWLPTTKRGKAYISQTNATEFICQETTPERPTRSVEQVAETPATPTTPVASPKKTPFVPDRTPPAEGEPTVRYNPKFKGDEFWCGVCPQGGRWGNHSSEGHAEWWKNFQAKRNERKKSLSPETETATPASPPKTMRTNTTAAVSQKASLTDMLRRQFVSFQDSSDEE